MTVDWLFYVINSLLRKAPTDEQLFLKKLYKGGKHSQEDVSCLHPPFPETRIHR